MDKKEEIKLSDHFNYKKLFKFTLPSVIMMIFTSIYGVIDGFFVSNYVGKTEFAAVNFIMPFLMIFGAVGFMIGTGGSALVAATLGKKENQKANEIFSLLIYVLTGIGIIFTILGVLFIRPVTVMLGASEAMTDYCIRYGEIILFAIVPFMLQNVFQSFLVTAERPKLGLYITVAAGLCNIVLDWLLMAVFSFGVEGAAFATAISQFVGGMIPLVYFMFSKNCIQKLGKTKFYGRELIKACANGSSEFMTNVSMSIVNMLYNSQLMKLAGENGVAAYGVIMYVNFIFVSVYIGYSIGAAPITAYHYGAGNSEELQNVRKKSVRIIFILAFILTALAELMSYPLSSLFVGYDENLFGMTLRGFMFYSLSYLLCGFNIYGSSLFTSLNNGGISALISFGRMFIFQTMSVTLLPIFLGLDGIWLSIVLAEFLSLALTSVCFVMNQKKYHY